MGRPFKSHRRPWISAHRVLVVGGLLIALQVAFRAWAVYGSWFQFDDFAFLSRAHNSGLTWEYLTESYAGHLMPAGFLVTWLFADFDPLGFAPYATTLLALQTVASIGFLRLLIHMFGRRTAVLPLLSIYLFSVISLPAYLWWAAGINQLPMLIALFFGLHSHISYLRTRRLRHLFATLGWTVFGLLFYEKTLFVILVYGLVALCYFASGTVEERVKQLWATYRPGLGLHGLLTVGYLALYVTTSLNFDPNNANETPLFPVAYRLIFVAFSTGAVGGPWQWTEIDPIGTVAGPGDIAVFLSWLALGFLAYVAYQTRVNSARAWLLTVVPLAANVILLAAGRAFAAGPDIGLEYRYQTEMSALLSLSVGLAFLSLAGAVESAEAREKGLAPLPTARMLVYGFICYIALAMVSNVQYVQSWQGRNMAFDYFQNVEAAFSGRSGGRVPLADLAVPQYIMWGFRYPENTYSHVFPMYADHTSYPSVTTDELFVLDGRGRLRPAVITSVRRNVPAGGACGYRVTDSAVTIPLDDPVVGGGWWVRLGYLANGDSPITIDAGDRTHRTRIEEGVHSLYFRADGDFRQIVLSGLREGVGLCTDDVTLGVPRPYAAS